MEGARAFFRSLFGVKQESVVTPAALEADTFANEFAVPGKRTVITDGYKVELDLTDQVLACITPLPPNSTSIRSSIVMSSANFVTRALRAQKSCDASMPPRPQSSAHFLAS